MIFIYSHNIKKCHAIINTINSAWMRKDIIYPQKQAYLSSSTNLTKSCSVLTVGVGLLLCHFASALSQNTFYTFLLFKNVAFTTFNFIRKVHLVAHSFRRPGTFNIIFQNFDNLQ